MELVDRFRVPNRDVWFVQAVLTDCEGQAVVSLGERETDESIMSVLYDDSAEGELAPLFAYLTAVGKIVPVFHDKP
ncbi:hypothetical protein SMC3_06550 [Candidatus Cryosericum hinesii]|jgi:hypothetical protein|uniref:Uncharacterized protein n=2 Tax=Candidatus Cryosericum TaxID=2498709 RepID=A0A398DK71_9BACT|nr:hypothetical protein [Candidatus Cryosericum hinesii]RIE09856.1 hypothetical protein SMC4_03865 [Candidatus Cryosericum hinesii]RIE12558.1 hypothetical protein SMC3_06550 [Candidatus Cryosericum hinesii]RIE12598.1 hypothetical protein SMC2_06740 [Candidatus Cryosericum hinesii]